MSNRTATRRDFLASAVLGAAGSRFLTNGRKPTELLPFAKISGGLKAAENALPLNMEDRAGTDDKTTTAGGRPVAERLYGLLIDAARVPESLSYYYRLIDFCTDWGMNTLVFTLADDQGSALHFKSHPELLTHKHALTHEEARQLAEYSNQHGVDLIPLIESFGHTRYITAVSQYAHLADKPPGSNGEFTGLIPVAPESIRLLNDLYREIASIFPSPYLHGGCDEVGWGAAKLSRRALETKTRAQIWDEYLNSLNQICQGLGKQFIVWGDYVLRKEPQILNGLDKNIIIMDWDYWDSDPLSVTAAAHKALGMGFSIIGAPSFIWCEWGPRPGISQLRNIDAYADAYLKIADRRCLGLVVTNWLPSRYIQQSIWDGLAYGAIAMREGSAVAHHSAFRRFVERFYGAKWNETWADVFQTYYNIVPNRKSCAPHWMRPTLPVPWSTEQDLVVVLKAGLVEAPPFTRLRSQLVFCEPLVRRNLSDFNAFRLSVEYLEHLFWRNTALVQEATSTAQTQESAVQFIKALAERDQSLLQALERDWDEGRPRDSSAKLEHVYDFEPEDQLVFSFRRAAEFSNRLAHDPDHFLELLRRYKIDQERNGSLGTQKETGIWQGMKAHGRKGESDSILTVRKV